MPTTIRENDFNFTTRNISSNPFRQITSENAATSEYPVTTRAEEEAKSAQSETIWKYYRPIAAPVGFTFFSLMFAGVVASLSVTDPENSAETTERTVLKSLIGATGIFSLLCLWHTYELPWSNFPPIKRAGSNMSSDYKRRISAGVGVAWVLPFLLNCFFLTGLFLDSIGITRSDSSLTLDMFKNSYAQFLVLNLRNSLRRNLNSSYLSLDEPAKINKIMASTLNIWSTSWVLHSGIHLQRHAKDMIKTGKEIKDLCCETFQHFSASSEENTQNTREFTVNNDEPSASSSINNNLSNNVNTLPNSHPTTNSTETEILIHNPPSSKIDTSLNNASTLPNSESTSIAIEIPMLSPSRASI